MSLLTQLDFSLLPLHSFSKCHVCPHTLSAPTPASFWTDCFYSVPLHYWQRLCIFSVVILGQGQQMTAGGSNPPRGFIFYDSRVTNIFHVFNNFLKKYEKNRKIYARDYYVACSVSASRCLGTKYPKVSSLKLHSITRLRGLAGASLFKASKPWNCGVSQGGCSCGGRLGDVRSELRSGCRQKAVPVAPGRTETRLPHWWAAPVSLRSFLCGFIHVQCGPAAPNAPSALRAWLASPQPARETLSLRACVMASSPSARSPYLEVIGAI